MSGVYRRRIPYIPDRNAYRDYYRGSGLPVFRGVYQDGSGIFGNIWRSVAPILKSTALSAGKGLLRTGTNVLSDMLEGRSDLKTSLRERGKEGLKTLGGDVLGQLQSKLQQKGGGRRGRRKTTRVSSAKKRKGTPDIFDNIYSSKRGSKICKL